MMQVEPRKCTWETVAWVLTVPALAYLFLRAWVPFLRAVW